MSKNKLAHLNSKSKQDEWKWTKGNLPWAAHLKNWSKNNYVEIEAKNNFI